MRRSNFFLSILVLVALLAGCAPQAAAQPKRVKALENPGPTNVPEVLSHDPPFVPPTPYDSMGYKGEFWYGSKSLWTNIRQNGTWEALPHNPEGYTQKVFWWRDGYVWNEEPEPALTVTGERLDAQAAPLRASKATNASASDIGSAMLVG